MPAPSSNPHFSLTGCSWYVPTYHLLVKPAEDQKLYGCLLVATLNSCINGYDGSLMGSINSYPQYRSYFGLPLESGTPSTGIVYAIYTIGNIVGSFAAGPATDTYGMAQIQNKVRFSR